MNRRRATDSASDRVSGWAVRGGGVVSLPGAPPATDAVADAVSGLIALGYKPQEASRLVNAIDTEGKANDAIIREVLRGLARS